MKKSSIINPLPLPQNRHSPSRSPAKLPLQKQKSTNFFEELREVTRVRISPQSFSRDQKPFSASQSPQRQFLGQSLKQPSKEQNQIQQELQSELQQQLKVDLDVSSDLSLVDLDDDSFQNLPKALPNNQDDKIIQNPQTKSNLEILPKLAVQNPQQFKLQHQKEIPRRNSQLFEDLTTLAQKNEEKSQKQFQQFKELTKSQKELQKLAPQPKEDGNNYQKILKEATEHTKSVQLLKSFDSTVHKRYQQINLKPLEKPDPWEVKKVNVLRVFK